MRTVGLIGGTTWLSTMDYYRIINQEVNRQLGSVHSAKLILYSIDFDEFRTLSETGNWGKITEWFAGIAQQVQTLGAEAIVLCANTLHLMVDKF
jgi:Aspartate racemase